MNKNNDKQELVPRMDAFRCTEEYRVLFDVPGVSSESTKLTSESSSLVVQATVEVDGRSVTYARRLDLPADAVAEDTTASLCDGVLEAKIPRRVPAEPRAVAVQST